MRRIKAWWKPLVLGLACSLLAGNIIRAALADPPSRPRPKDVAHAAREVRIGDGLDPRSFAPAGDWVGGNGIVEPADREVRVASDVAGRVVRVLVTEREHVAAGDVLVELEHQVQKAQLAAAGAELSAAEAEYARVARGNRTEDVEAMIAEAEAAASQAQTSEAVAARLNAAERGGGVTADEADRARHQAKVDRAAAKAAEARRTAAVAGSRREDIAEARAKVVAATARRDQAQASLALRLVTTPSAGEVLQVKVRPGEYYQPGSDALIVLGDSNQVRARIDVDERDVGRVSVGARAVIRSSAFPGVDFEGSVVEVARRMGRKNVRTDDPLERNDTKILEVVARLERAEQLYFGQRVMGYLTASRSAESAASSASVTNAATNARKDGALGRVPRTSSDR